MTDLYTLNPEIIVLYGVDWCGDCRRARRVFEEKKVIYLDVDIDQDVKASEFVKGQHGGSRSVPTIIFPDGSVLTEPDSQTLLEKLETCQPAA